VFYDNLLDKHRASQPTISRFVYSLDETAIEAFNRLVEILFEKGKQPKETKQIILDLDSRLFTTFGKQEGSAFNFHQAMRRIEILQFA
jgi:hypothetical protein